MEFRRSGQSNQRRRRVLKEDTTATTENNSEGQPKRRGRGAGSLSRPYSEAALHDYQPRVTDLIPKRPWTLLVLVLCALLAVSTVQALYAHMHVGAHWVGGENLRALDPTETGSLAGWLSSTMLGLAGVASVAIYSIRRHRLDDYRGRYRVWLTCAVLCILASIDATTALHRVPRGLFDLAIVRVGGNAWADSRQVGWVLIVLIGVGVSGLRLVAEARRSLGAVAWLIASLGAYALVGAIELESTTFDFGVVATLVESSARLTGDVALLCALFTYARYVYLDAQGILAQRRAAREAARRKRRAEKAARAEAKAQAKAHRLAEKEEARAARIAAKRAGKKPTGDAEEDEDESSEAADSHKTASQQRNAPSSTPTAAQSRPDPRPPLSVKPAGFAKPVPPTPVDDDDDEDDEDDSSGLSRAERRRLKKLARREGRRAA